ncbi:AMP-binding enzyme [Agrococcus sp. TSP3-2-1]|uniref:AMP-binding enzyme n=1 Tax=Agrococcus sp. TSP3-2-1 TaxID=2804583 RepID=UPI003CF99B6E
MRRTTKFAGVGVAFAALAHTACEPTASTSSPATASSEGAEEIVAVNVGMITSIAGPLAAYGAAYQQGFAAGSRSATPSSSGRGAALVRSRDVLRGRRLRAQDHPQDAHPQRHAAAGRPYPHVDVALLVDGRVQSAPGRGELLVRGPAVVQGCFRDPAATAEARFGSWLRTGDLVERDPAGRIRVVDRMKDIERWGEEVVAWLVLEGVATEEDLRGHLDGRIADFKHPERFVVVDGIPRTSTGKPLRRALAASLEQQGAVS